MIDILFMSEYCFDRIECQNSMDSMEFHGIHGIPWNPWNSMESMEFHGQYCCNSTVQYCTVLYSTVQYSTVLYSTVHDTTRHDRHDTTRHDTTIPRFPSSHSRSLVGWIAGPSQKSLKRKIRYHVVAGRRPFTRDSKAPSSHS